MPWVRLPGRCALVVGCATLLVLPGCSAGAPAACSSADPSGCHGHITLTASMDGSVSLDGVVEDDYPPGVLCATPTTAGTLWTVPFPATPTPVDGHLFYGQGTISTTNNLGPGTYPVSSVDNLQLVVDADDPFVPGSGTVSFRADGSGRMQLAGFTNGSGQVNATVSWTCSDVATT